MTISPPCRSHRRPPAAALLVVLLAVTAVARAADTDAHVVVTNHTDKVVRAVWHNPDGGEKAFGEVKPGGALDLDTYTGQKWSFRDAATGKVLKELTAVKGKQAVEIGGTAALTHRVGAAAADVSVNNRTGRAVQYALVGPDGKDHGSASDMAPHARDGSIIPAADLPGGNLRGYKWVVRDKTTGKVLAEAPADAGRKDLTVGDPAGPGPAHKGPATAKTTAPAKVPVPAGATGSAVTRAEADDYVAFHNKARKEVGVGPVKWSPVLAKYAQAWADKLAESGDFKHSRGEYGENIAIRGTPEAPAREAAEAWYEEKPLYTPGTPIPGGDAFYKAGYGHYTQMVWKGTTEVGVGRAVYKTGPYQGQPVFVGSYNPGGNTVGEKPY